MKYRVFSSLILIALCAIAVQAQSGRRQPRAVPSAPIPTPTPEPTPEPKKEKPEAEMIFYVGADTHSSYGSIPLVYFDAAVRGCADRLREGSSADVDIAQRDLGRGDAIKKAKSSHNTYVVLLSLSIDAMSRSYDDLQLDFVVFAPTTSKVVISGRSYMTGGRVGPVIAGPTGGGAIFREQRLKQAGEDAASRILKAVNRVNRPKITQLAPKKIPESL